MIYRRDHKQPHSIPIIDEVEYHMLLPDGATRTAKNRYEIWEGLAEIQVQLLCRGYEGLIGLHPKDDKVRELRQTVIQSFLRGTDGQKTRNLLILACFNPEDMTGYVKPKDLPEGNVSLPWMLEQAHSWVLDVALLYRWTECCEEAQRRLNS